ncbi:MAG: NUDIX hydrolase [Armatimonadota bacterium]|nr:NUDIX hydrolase [Armatimonadota bacterium]
MERSEAGGHTGGHRDPAARSDLGAGDSAEPTVASRLVFRGRVVAVRVDDVRLGSGRVVVREVVEHPGATAVVPVTGDGHVLMVRQYRKAVEAFLLEIPAGTLEPGESPDQCAQRELAEEVGMRAGRLTPLATYFPSPGVLTEAITVYLAEDLHPHVLAADPGEEGLEVERVPLDRVPALIASGGIRDGKSLVGLLLALRALGAARTEGP